MLAYLMGHVEALHHDSHLLYLNRLRQHSHSPYLDRRQRSSHGSLDRLGLTKVFDLDHDVRQGV